MTIPWRRSGQPMIGLLIIAVMLGGCASTLQNIDDQIQRQRYSLAYDTFENALAVYDQGDYTKALTLFQAIGETNAGEAILRKSRLGEICCRLMLATTPAAFDAAMEMWRAFAESAPDQHTSWDVILLNPLISRSALKSAAPIRVPQPSPPAPARPAGTPEVWPKENQQLLDEIADLKKEAQRAAQLQRQIDQVVAENQALKEKIKALEAIDQQIQKKKTEIGVASE